MLQARLLRTRHVTQGSCDPSVGSAVGGETSVSLAQTGAVCDFLARPDDTRSFLSHLTCPCLETKTRRRYCEVSCGGQFSKPEPSSCSVEGN